MGSFDAGSAAMRNQMMQMRGMGRVSSPPAKTLNPGTGGVESAANLKDVFSKSTPESKEATIKRAIEAMMTGTSGTGSTPNSSLPEGGLEPKKKDFTPAWLDSTDGPKPTLSHTPTGELRSDYGEMSIYSNGDVTFGNTHRSLRDHGTW